jgi:hypothetical protein
LCWQPISAKRADTLNIAIVAFNQAIGPLSQAVGDTLEDYSGILEKVRDLAGIITETAHAAFDTKFAKWQGSDTGIQVRNWNGRRASMRSISTRLSR